MNNVKRKTFSQEEKKAICQEVKNIIDTGKGIVEAEKEVAKKYKISQYTIKEWDAKPGFRFFSTEKKYWTDEKNKKFARK